MRTRQSIDMQKADMVSWLRRVARELCRYSVFAALIAMVFLASSTLLFAQHNNSGAASMSVTVSPADQLTTTGGTTADLKIRLGTGPAYLWGDSLSDCSSAPTIGSPTTISASGTYTPALSVIPFNTTSNDYVCVYDPGTPSLNTSVAWPHTGLYLAFTQQPTSAASGVSISPAVTVQVNDSNNIRVASSTAPVTIAITPGTPATGGPGALGGTLTQTAVNGVATFSGLSINTDGSNYSLTATSSGISNGTSNTFNITSGTATKLAFLQQPSTTTAGNAISPSVTVKVEDNNGNLVTTDNSNVTIAISSGGALSGSSTLTVAASGGVATFNNLIPTTAGSFTLSATDGSLTGATSSSFTVNPSTLDHFKVEKSGGGTIGTQTAGTAFNIRVTAQDVYNNTVTSFASSVQLTAAGATLSGSPVTSGAFASGVLDPQSVTFTTGAASVTITALGSGKSGTSSTFTVNQAPAITSANNATFTVGTSGSFTVTATGYPAPTFSETGSLPSGVTLSSAGVLSGTPAVGATGAGKGAGGSYPITITASNGVGSNATQTFTLTVQDFSISANPITASAKKNKTDSNLSTITVTSLGGFSGTVNFTCAYSGTPSTTSCSLSPASASVLVSTPGTATLTVSPPNSTGSGTATITATSGTIVESTTVAITVSN